MKNGLKSKINIALKSAIILLAIFILEYQTNNVVLNAQNSNLNKQLDLNTFAVLDITTAGYQQPLLEEMNIEESEDVVEPAIIEEPQEEVKQENTTLASYTGRMTGYVYNCPSCGGKLACDSSLDLSNGNVSYYDETYKNVRIVASSKHLECGSIVSIKSSLSDEPIIAIVLDRGVGGTKLDLLVSTEAEAYNNIGNKEITYDVLRNGY